MFRILEGLNTTNITNAYNTTEPLTPTGSEHSFLSVKTLIVIIILLLYTIGEPIFRKLNFHYMHESGISMILGFLVGLIAKLISDVRFYIHKRKALLIRLSLMTRFSLILFYHR